MLIRYGVLSENDLLDCGNRFLPPCVLYKLRCAEKPFIYGVMGLIFGVCKLSSDVYFKFGLWTFSVFPFIVYGCGNGMIRYYELTGTPPPSEYYALDFSEWVFMVSSMLTGVFLFIPFVSPSGLFAGFSVLTIVAGE